MRTWEAMRKRLTYANVVSTAVLFVALAGGTALGLPGKKTVQANDLKKNSVKAAAIAKNAVRAAEIKDGVIGGAEVADQGLGYEDLGSNSVIARIRTTGPVQTDDGGQANPLPVGLSGNQWTQAANEIDVLFGEVTFTQPPTCGGVFPDMFVEVFVDGESVGGQFLDADPNQTLSFPILDERPFLFEPGSPTQHTATAQIHDTCSGAGENYTLDELAVNVVAIR